MKYFELLFDPKVKEVLAQVLEVLGDFLEGEIEPEDALKKIFNIALEFILPGEEPPVIQFNK